MTTGACVRVEGRARRVARRRGRRSSSRPRGIELFGEADPASYPLQKKGHSFEFLREIAHLRPRTNTFGAVFRVRNAHLVRDPSTSSRSGASYVHTPIITASDAEGAGAMFGVTTLDLA